MSLVVSAFFAFVNAGTHCATLYEHHRCDANANPPICEHPDGGAQYNIIVGGGGETTNLAGGYSIDGFFQTSWWDDRVSSFTVQPDCKLEMWCEPDAWPSMHNNYKMGSGWTGPTGKINLINSWNDCPSKFRCKCGGYGRRMEDNQEDGLQQRREEILRELKLGSEHGFPQHEEQRLVSRLGGDDRLLEEAMKKHPVLAELIEKAVELEEGGEEQRVSLRHERGKFPGVQGGDNEDFVLWEGPDGEISATRPDGVESDE